MGLLDGKTAIVFGVANHRSIAWGIAQALQREGARLALTYQGERVEKYVRELATQLSDPLILPCDVGDDAQIEALYRQVGESFGRLDAVVHSVAFAEREDLEGRFVDTSRQGFRTALEISAYSLVAVARGALPLMAEGGSVVTLTFAGSVRAYPSYNVMGVAKAALEAAVRYLASDLGPDGVRVNAISAGPINTLSARGISGFSTMHKAAGERAPLRRTTTQAEVGDAAVFLVSGLSRGITAETLYVDNGLNSVAV
jgi:enoyl-[acyl-carrier protein] reductase I